jgi:hypothetical protein
MGIHTLLDIESMSILLAVVSLYILLWAQTAPQPAPEKWCSVISWTFFTLFCLCVLSALVPWAYVLYVGIHYLWVKH